MTAAPAELGETLGKKMGPLPGWAWVILVAGGAWALYWYRMHKTAGAAAPAATAPVAGAPVSDAYVPTGPQASTGSGVISTTPGVTAPATNAAWAIRAGNGLIAAGNSDANTIQNALQKYISGQGTLTGPEAAIVAQATTQYGLPPEGVLAVNNQVSNDFTGHVYTVQPGDTLYSIIQKFYGNHDPVNIGAQGRVLAAANNLSWDPATGSHPVTAGQQIRLYQDAVDIANHQPDSFHWTN